MKSKKPLEVRLPARTVLWVVAGMALVSAPHLLRLPLWLALSLPCVWLLRVAVVMRVVALPARWLLAAITVVAAGIVIASYGTLWGRDAGVALLNLMLALKLLELRTERDAYISVVLGFFVAITHFLYSQSIPMAGYTMLVVFALVTVMMEIEQLEMRASSRELLRQRLGLALRITAQAVPLVLVLFVFFPRITGPLWRLPLDAHSGITGLSNEMSPGKISYLSRSDAVAFRVEFEGDVPASSSLYWRGPVFSYFDGITWLKAGGDGGDRLHQVPPGLESVGARVDYSITVEPHHRHWVFALDLPGLAPPGASLTTDFQVLTHKRLRSRRRFHLSSYLDYRTGKLDDREWYSSLQLPASIGVRTRRLVKAWRRQESEPLQIVLRALEFFRRESFVYTLTPPLLGDQPVEEFLFETRSGFCEHYSSAFTLLMRLAGIPARVVTGYQGAERNPLGNYSIVRQSDAHAWSEVWLAERGWMRVDPTAAAAPERIERRINTSVLGAGMPVSFSVDADSWMGSVLRQARYGWDALNNGWNQWVLGYTQQRQWALLARLGLGRFDWKTLGAVLAVLFGAVLAVIGILTLARGRRSYDPVARAYETFCRKLGARGLTRAPCEGPVDYARRVCRDRPELAAQVSRITGAYVELRYGRGGVRIGVLQQLVREFRP